MGERKIMSHFVVEIRFSLSTGDGFQHPCAAPSCTLFSKLMSSRSSGVKVFAIFKVSIDLDFSFHRLPAHRSSPKYIPPRSASLLRCFSKHGYGSSLENVGRSHACSFGRTQHAWKIRTPSRDFRPRLHDVKNRPRPYALPRTHDLKIVAHKGTVFENQLPELVPIHNQRCGFKWVACPKRISVIGCIARVNGIFV